jgi:hypothetical protein
MIDRLDLLTGLSTLAYMHSTTRSIPYIAEKLGQIPSHTIGQPEHRAGPLVWGRTGARAFVAMTPRLRNELLLTNPVAQVAVGDGRLATVNSRGSSCCTSW